MSHKGVSWLSSPSQAEVVAHSPTPSMHRTAAVRKGDGKNAEAAEASCFSLNSIGRSADFLTPASAANALLNMDFRNSFSFSQTGRAATNDRRPRGANERYVSKSRSNFRRGLS